MHHVLLISYTQPIEAVNAVRPAHLEWIDSEIAAGKLILTGRNEHGTGGVLITGDISVDAAEDLIASDPYTKANVAQYSRTGFNVGKSAPGIA